MRGTCLGDGYRGLRIREIQEVLFNSWSPVFLLAEIQDRRNGHGNESDGTVKSGVASGVAGGAERILKKEKEFTRLRDEVSRQRREMPWKRVEKAYVFEGPSGKQTLADLFGGRNQLIVYHFMLGPDGRKGARAARLFRIILTGVWCIWRRGTCAGGGFARADGGD